MPKILSTEDVLKTSTDDEVRCADLNRSGGVSSNDDTKKTILSR